MPVMMTIASINEQATITMNITRLYRRNNSLVVFSGLIWVEFVMVLFCVNLHDNWSDRYRAPVAIIMG